MKIFQVFWIIEGYSNFTLLFIVCVCSCFVNTAVFCKYIMKMQTNEIARYDNCWENFYVLALNFHLISNNNVQYTNLVWEKKNITTFHWRQNPHVWQCSTTEALLTWWQVRCLGLFMRLFTHLSLGHWEAEQNIIDIKCFSFKFGGNFRRCDQQENSK